MNKNDIENIEKIFNVECIGNSRIDGRPIFKIDKRNIDYDGFRECFDLQLVSLLEDHIPTVPSYPAGQKDYFIVKIHEIKKEFNQYLRGEKLRRINIEL